MPETTKTGHVLLIVDNSLLIIERLLSILKEVPAVEKVFKATNYNDAIDVLRKNKTNIVLMDIQLSEKQGIALLKHIVEEFAEVKVIVLSNLASDYYRKLCKNSGAAYFIDKSKDFDMIPEIISSI